jgi:tryptophan synthase
VHNSRLPHIWRQLLKRLRNAGEKAELARLLRDAYNFELTFCMQAALITYVTAGFPSAEATPDILLGMEAGGADLIELGMPFTDPIADGPTIQKSNTQALKNGITTEQCLQMVRDARSRGLKAPVLLMGYYNPLLSYGEEKILDDAREAGANGFIIVDLPPEEAIRFRNFCKRAG